MGGLVSNIWFITIVGGVFYSLVAALIVAYMQNRRPSLLKIYREALRDLCEDANIAGSDKHVLQNALKDPTVIKAITTRAANPVEEAQCLCKAIEYRAPRGSQFSDPERVAELVGRLLENEFRIEGTDKYLKYHDRNRDRQSYFALPPAPTGLTYTSTFQQIVLTWNPVPHPGIWRYHVARSTNVNGPFTEVGIVLAEVEDVLSFTDDEGLLDSPIYYYAVAAESKVLKRGPASPMLASLAAAATPESSFTPVVSSSFFSPREIWQEIAQKCVDRKEDLEKLLSDFSDPGRRLILIEGFGGLGKTTLSARLALTVSSRYNVLWMDCQGIPIAIERFLREMGRLASDQYRYPLLSAIVANPQCSQEEKDNALLDFLAFASRLNNRESPQRIALFFDDFHLVTDSALKQLVLKIVESHLEVKVVLVIRFLPAELQNEVDTAAARQLEGLDFEGCRELVGVYAASYPGLRGLDDRGLYRIWKLTGQGVPTALKILVSMTRTLSLEDSLEELPALTAATREKWFDKLFRELSADEQLVAAETSIFRRPTSRRTLIAVSRCPRAKEVIEALVDRFVLTFDGRQYFMHTLWSDYTRQFLSPSEAKELHRRAAIFYHEFVSEDWHAQVMSRLESCYHFVEAGEMEQAEEELASIAGTLRSWGFFREFADILAQIEKNTVDKGKPLVPQLSLEKSAMLYAQGAVDEAISILSELAGTNTGKIEIEALQELGWIYIEIGRRRDAERLLELSRQLAHQSNLPKLEAEALSKLQHMAYHECDYDKALAYNQERLSILQQMQDSQEVREAIAWIHHEIGNVYRERGVYDKALEYYQRDLYLWNKSGNPPSRVGWITYDIGQIYRDQGRLKDAMKQFEDALQIFNEMQHLFGIAHVKVELGRVGVKLGPTEPALNEIEEAIDLLRKVKGVAGEAYALGALGQVYLGLGKPDLALPKLQQSLKIETELGSIKGRAWSLHQISLTYEQQAKRLLLSGNNTDACSRFREARETITQAQELFAQIGAVPTIYGVQDNAERIQRECAECPDNT